MRKRMSCLIFSMFLFYVSCAEFDRFERIEDDKLRIIGVRYEGAAEFAPGDTLTGRVYFAGNTIASVSDFSIAYIHQVDKNHIFPDEEKITLLDTMLWFPDSMQFRYVIPRDVFLTKKTQGIQDTALIRRLYDLVPLIAQFGDSALTTIDPDTLQYLISSVGNLYAQPGIFFYANSVNGTTLKVRSEFTIRYNSLLSDYLPVNNNPQIKWIAVYKVPSGKSEDFYPHKPDLGDSTSITYLYNAYYPETVSDTVLVDKGYDYFLACNQGIDFHLTPGGDTVHDTTCDFFKVPGNDKNVLSEEYTYKWFFQNQDDLDEIKDSLLVLTYENSGPGYIKIKTPVFTEMTHFKVWVAVYDFITGMYSRPRGFAIGSGDGVFKYTEQYKER